MRKKALLIVAVLVAFSGIILANRPVQPEPKVAYGPLLSPAEVRDPAIATQYGIRGYVVVSTAKDTPSSLSVKKGTSKSITILAKFVSHVPETNETTITLNASSGVGLSIEQCYALVNEKGEVYAEGTINVDKLISYEPSGKIRVKSGEAVPIKVVIAVPSDCPSISFPLGAVGLMVEDGFALIDEVEVWVYATRV